ncbi:MAG: ribonuclease HII [Candidatus Portnoybacteria bacterium]|nr:ribonuclease HII [Candidatus Portnoybacteria bacterium]
MKKEKFQPKAGPPLAGKIKNYPNFNEEKNYWKRGYRVVVGLDEVGRGPLAGPVVASAVIFKFSSPPQLRRGSRGGVDKNGFHHPTPTLPSFEGRRCMVLRDSKQLSAVQREIWYEFLTSHPDIKWGVGVVSEKIIDRINIFEATKLAMKKAMEKLSVQPDFLLLDGNFILEDLSINQKAVIKGDEKIFSCAAASIIAKVTRDRLMTKYAKKYPEYGFEKHKGYGTRLHCEALKKHGPCKIHRKSFRLK